MGSTLLTAREVQDLLDVDKSTVYRMASDGRLPAIKVGRQWRFPADRISELLQPAGTPRNDEAGPLPADVLDAVIELAADLLGVMIVVTDMDGVPLSRVVNPCPAFEKQAEDDGFLAECLEDWREFVHDFDLEPRFRPGRHGFECARTFVRRGPELVAMVLAGGVAPDGVDDPDLYHLSAEERGRVLAGLGTVARVLSRVAGHETTQGRGPDGAGPQARSER